MSEEKQNNTIYGECPKHKGSSMINCPECAMEDLTSVPKINLEKFKESLEKLTPEEVEKYFPEDKTPKGWVSIEEHLPAVTIDDLEKNGGMFKVIKVKTDKNRIGISQVGDHQIWYYQVKDLGVTHWWNGPFDEVDLPKIEDIKIYTPLLNAIVKCSNPKCKKELTTDEILMHQHVAITDPNDMECQKCWMQAAYGYR